MMNDRLIAALQNPRGPEAIPSACQNKARPRGRVSRQWGLVVLLLLAGTLAGASAGWAQPTPEAVLHVQEVPDTSEEETNDTLSALAPFLYELNDANADANSQVDLLVDAFGPQLVESHFDFEVLEREDRMRRLRQFCTLGVLLVILLVVYTSRKRENT